MKILTGIIIVTILIVGCSKDNTIKLDCIESVLIEYDMVEYKGQEVGCKLFMALYHHNNKQFFLLGNHCADMITYPIDCKGNVLCKDGGKYKCKMFWNNAERIGIIGIKE